jgi:hypothetical protein
VSDGADVQRILGDFGARITALERARREDRVLLQEIHQAVTSARGGWAAVAWMGGAAATIAGVVTAIYHFIFSR